MSDFPGFYDPERVGTLFYPDMGAISAAAEEAERQTAVSKRKLVQLLLIDMQVDFCHEAGSLFVPGAPDDLRRVIEFIFTYGHYISKITCTLDSHLPFQIFHPSWWADAEGNPPDPMTIITADDMESGRWRSHVMTDYSAEYVRQLEAQSKKQLLIWPYHVLIGSMGNALDPSLWSAVMWHALAHQSQPGWLPKGMVPQTEHYSAIQPEIPVEDHPQGGKNQVFLDSLANSDLVLVAGEAESHCVLETLEDIVAEYEAQPEELNKYYVLQDCMSPVQHPEVDFHAMALEKFTEFKAAGLHFINSTDPAPFIEAVTAEPEKPGPFSF